MARCIRFSTHYKLPWNVLPLALIRGEHCVTGFRNRDIRDHLDGTKRDRALELRNSAAVSRLFNRLRVHGLVAKIPRSRRWRVTKRGYAPLAFSLRIYQERNAETPVDVAA
jgi:hypothetical protein